MTSQLKKQVGGGGVEVLREGYEGLPNLFGYPN